MKRLMTTVINESDGDWEITLFDAAGNEVETFVGYDFQTALSKLGEYVGRTLETTGQMPAN